ncbi:helix-turn-helix domain-containing protein [Marinobacter nauticus]|uniref:helix-turn-helix domain-containing protein n=1 Tax=Marinobacter nauticus TaxID=2743 RepID=UPI000EB069AC|nr:helix-turn-helix domain-containing protein [Marinobacter nauticus]RKR72122.1 AraC family transcriptional regulator [Marinobacter nauticus]
MTPETLAEGVSPPDQTQPRAHFSRISQVLDYVHRNLDHPLAVDHLAGICGWSRWQFNRVFARETGRSLGRYVRELRLSLAAEMLLFTDQRVIDISIACGFNSDISFARSFRQYFGCSPRHYRQRGLPCLLKAPIECQANSLPPATLQARLPEIRLDHREAFSVTGIAGDITGLFSDTPNFRTRVPELWAKALDSLPIPPAQCKVGVLDASGPPGAPMRYLAGVEGIERAETPDAKTLTVPARNYVVISFRGPLASLSDILQWFFDAWLPNAGCSALNGYDLEVYPAGFDPSAPEIAMEYWIPVRLVRPLIGGYAPKC